MVGTAAVVASTAWPTNDSTVPPISLIEPPVVTVTSPPAPAVIEPVARLLRSLSSDSASMVRSAPSPTMARTAWSTLARPSLTLTATVPPAPVRMTAVASIVDVARSATSALGPSILVAPVRAVVSPPT